MAKSKFYDVDRIEPLKGVMKRFLRDSGLAWMLKHQDIVELWNNAVGEEISAQTRVRSLRGGVLHINVESPVLRGELEQFHAPAILQAIREGGKDIPVRKLTFHLVQLDPEAGKKEEEDDGEERLRS